MLDHSHFAFDTHTFVFISYTLHSYISSICIESIIVLTSHVQKIVREKMKHAKILESKISYVCVCVCEVNYVHQSKTKCYLSIVNLNMLQNDVGTPINT